MDPQSPMLRADLYIKWVQTIKTPNGKGFLVKKIENATDYGPVPGGLFLSGIWGRISLCMKGSLFQRSV